MKIKFMILKGLKVIAGITFFVLLFGFGTMHLWNWLIPALFHGPIISFCQAIGLIILSKILFGGFHGRWSGKGHCGHNRNHWKQRMEERIATMSPEEKEKFKNKCGGKFWTNTEPEQKTV